MYIGLYKEKPNEDLKNIIFRAKKEERGVRIIKLIRPYKEEEEEEEEEENEEEEKEHKGK